MTDEAKRTMPGAGRAAARHVENRLVAFLDGRLSATEAQAVRDHCGSCASCDRARREMEAVWTALVAGGQPALARPLWPLVAARLERGPARGGLALRLGAAAAAAAGVVLGVHLGSPATQEQAWTQETWTQMGSLLEDNQETLDNIYLSLADRGGEEQ